jgi:hypothetical protein
MWTLMNNMYKGMTFKVKWDNNLTNNIKETTHMSQNFSSSVLLVRLLRIVLLYLLHKRVDSFAPCRIPCAMLILSVRLLSHLTLNVIPLYMLFIRVHISPSTPSYKVC